ncbi:hypothetical protein D1816_20945 [Aquimarina sp. AD10]|uniref:hypothetical protein n=1 Tax=Aquimarina sp. AD10 TaxID=1714849 RepID=UPI000E4BA5F0|nr:hypothetical protein [Aquimarina sp. AD10]AXT62704.1 hypothetical protein D1816_20945 [Aquimarina sp. AD10]RKN01887.1 hypothetical protein D7033_02310 [Aquimarina sp. AD10]
MKIYQSYLKEYSKGIIGYSPIAIIGQSCLGSVAAMFILMNGNSAIQMIQLFIITIMCMFYNAAILSQQKPKISFNLLVMSVAFSISFTIINLI